MLIIRCLASALTPLKGPCLSNALKYNYRYVNRPMVPIVAKRWTANAINARDLPVTLYSFGFAL